MVRQGSDLSSSCITIITLYFLTGGGLTNSAPSPNVSHQDYVFSGWLKNITASQPFQLLIIGIMNGWIRWRLGVGSKMVTTTWFAVKDGVKKLACGHRPLFTPRYSVSLDWVGQFTASQPFQYLIISIMNGWTRFRFEFIMYNHHHILLFDWWVVTIFAPSPNVSY